jgi:predicted transcriptional regulator
VRDPGESLRFAPGYYVTLFSEKTGVLPQAVLTRRRNQELAVSNYESRLSAFQKYYEQETKLRGRLRLSSEAKQF